MEMLKPCPFCGHSAMVNYEAERNAIDIHCSYCNCSMTGFYVYFRSEENAFGEAAKNAFRAWNRRTNDV